MEKSLNKEIASIEREKIIFGGQIERVKETFIEEIKKANLREMLKVKPIEDIKEIEAELLEDKKSAISIREKIRKGLGITNF